MRNSGVVLWISSKRSLFPPALQQFGIDPSRIIFIDLQRDKELNWVMEEAVKCHGLAAVISELPELDFTTSRRLQLAAEQSRVTGFIIRSSSKKIQTTACFTRWEISPLPSIITGDLPGVGYKRWKVDLLKVRNGKPGSWDLQWDGFRMIEKEIEVPYQWKQKTG